MKVSILGGGAVGLVLASELSAVAECTLLVRRSEQSDLVNNKGVVFTRGESTRVVDVTATANPAEIADAELVIATTKTYDVSDAAKLIAKWNETAIVLCLQTGLGILDVFNETCGRNRVIGAINYMGGERISDNEVKMGANIKLSLGEQSSDITPRIEQIQALLIQANIDCEVSNDLTALIWRKLSSAVAQHALSALTDCTFVELHSSPQACAIAKALLEELEAVGKCENVNLNSDLLGAVMANWQKNPSHRSSMWKDLQMGRRTEIDAMNGALSILGKEHGVATPTNDLITSLIKAAERASYARSAS